MMSDSKEQVRDLFNLKKEEKILDDFGCSLAETIPIPGRLYLTEHYICFGSNLFGFNKKYSIAFNEITELKLKKSNIEIESKNNLKKKYSFTSFNDIQIVYKRIKSMCRSYNENNSTYGSETKDKEEITPITLTDSEDSDDESEDFANDKTLSSSKKLSYNSNSSNEDSPKSNNSINEDKSNNIINNNTNKNLINNLIENKNSIELKNSQTIPNLKNGEKIKNENIISTHSSKNLNEKTDVKRKKSSSSIKSKQSDNDKSPNKKENNIIEEEEIKFNPIDEDLDFEVCRKIINLSPKDFFEKYQTNAFPETSYKKYYEWVGDYSEINVPDWEKIENHENLEIKENPENSEVEKYQRIETFCLALHGVPLINKSHVVKTLKYWIEKDGTYYITTSSKSQGVPLSDCFLVETTLELHPYMNNTKTVFRTYIRTNIIKSTLLKGTLISQGKKTYTQEINKWLQFIEEKGDKIEGDYVYKPKKRKNSFGDKYRSLSHGLEKEISQMSKEKHIVDFKDFCYDICVGTKKYAKISYEYFYKEFDKKTRAILIFLSFIFIMMLSIIQGQSKEIKELKNEISEVKLLLNNLTKIVLEFKSNGK